MKRKRISQNVLDAVKAVSTMGDMHSFKRLDQKRGVSNQWTNTPY